MNKTKLATLVEETLESMNGAQRAEPAPYLLTRINAKLNREEPSAWERISLFLSRPGIAIAAVAFLIILNLLIYSFTNSSIDINLQNLQGTADEYSMNNSSSLFDLENIQP
ncbi:MAG TPA: hypothetical protein VLR49_10380 [Ferruginibacter sp.]|nr:hypothetical protein [Ferruginibacter sp.]